MSQNFLAPFQETKLISRNYDLIVGIDEAGRGPWAGPVAVGFFLYLKGDAIIEGIDDSKSLSSKARGIIFPELISTNDNFCLLGTSKQIDEIGIGKTIERLIGDGIKKILAGNTDARILFLIDGYFKENFDAEYELIKKGDSKYYVIAAASIIAKETRDNLMRKFAVKFPKYGFEKHMGYGTQYHRQMLQKYGPSEIHRRSFKPVRDFI
ncbi:ribonuclease HII [Candidatus Dojkabacteria bacterium]|nr:ribonuclease HII [Candidatus Dojkabacteria bacterium]